MSKKKHKKTQGRSKSIKSRKSVPAKSVRAKKKGTLYPLMTEPPLDPKDGWYRKIFYALGAFFLLFMIVGGIGSGINADDEFQHDYSKKLVQYYATMGKDTSAYYIEKGNMHYYGGFFDLATGIVNESLGLESGDRAYNTIRHIFNAILGFLAILFVGFIAQNIAGWRAAILALLLIGLSPRFLGHSFMNPKDIPFAAGFAVALYYMLQLLRQLPKPSWKTLLGLVLGIALAFATRAGGVLLMAYLGLFMGLHFLASYGFKGLTAEKNITGRYLAYGTGVVLASFLLTLVTWPAALRDPINFTFEALSAFSELGVKIRVLFMGDSIMSDDVAWYYAVVWVFRTIPLYIHLGLILLIVFGRSLLKSYGWLSVFMLVFASFFPLIYIIVKDSILHDGWRHLMFIYPSMVVLAVLGWMTIEKRFSANRNILYAIYGVLALSALEPASFIARNFQYPYIYFNPIGGGLKGAFGHFETDYWGISVKKAIRWMEKEEILSKNMPDTVVIGTNFYYNLSRQLKEDYKVRIKYVRFNRRYTEDWDYGVFPSRYIRGAHLRTGNWPNSKNVHVVKANGTPLLAIEKDTQDDAYQGERALIEKNWSEAVNSFRQETANYPDNEAAWLGLANAQINTGAFDEAINAADKALEIAPESENAYYYKGLANVQKGQIDQATRDLERAIEINDEYYVAHYYLAVILQSQGNFTKALEYIQAAILVSPSFKAAYELAASIYEQQGDTRNAQLYRTAAGQLR